MPKQIKLSVSKQTIRRKSEGEYVTGFEVKSFDLECKEDIDALQKLLQQNLYSTNVWGNPKDDDASLGCTGSCHKKKYLGMHGIVIDVDVPGMSIEQAQAELQDYVYLLHTSSGHQVDKPDKGGICDRYRVILPFEPMPDGSMYYTIPAEADKLFMFLKKKFPYADPTIFERARKLYPFAGEDRSKYQFSCQTSGKYISFSKEEIDAARRDSIKKQPKKQRKPHDKDSDYYVKYNVTTGDAYYSPSGEEYIMPDEIIDANVDGAWIEMPFQSLKEQMILKGYQKITAYCNHCDDHDSQSPSAFVYVDFRGFYHLECTHCKSERAKVPQYSWREYPVSDAMFSQNKKIYEIRIKSAEHIGPQEISIEEWKNDAEADFAIQKIKKTRFFLPANFTINYFSDPTMASPIPKYELSFQQNKIDIVYPIAEAKVEDNQYIDAYLDEVFGKYSEFIKDWMAAYTYTDYVSLPVLVLVGGRGSGKNTFVQMVGDIYNMLWAQWTGDRERFNNHYTKKLLWIDENSFGDKRSQYDELKYLTGNQYVTVEEKFQPKYRVRNNIKVILTTNDFRPLAVKNEEAPTSDKDNNFFFYEFQSLASDKRDRTLGKKLKERIGHYCRTELKERYDEIIANLDNRCRYLIPCPITEYSNKVYVMAKTDVELTIEELIPMLKARSNSHITYQEFRHMLKDYGIVTNNANVKQYLTLMQHKKVLSFEETRTRACRLGYKILVEREDALGVDLEGDIVDEPLYLSRLAV